MTDFVRVQQENGLEVTLSADYVEGLEDKPKVLDVPATNSRGVPLPATRKGGRPLLESTTVDAEAAKKADSKTK